jgi:hypothetical protein
VRGGADGQGGVRVRGAGLKWPHARITACAAGSCCILSCRVLSASGGSRTHTYVSSLLAPSFVFGCRDERCLLMRTAHTAELHPRHPNEILIFGAPPVLAPG